jgi:Arc/MetJ-type ribon-helix-helix transcriptional regulator
LKQYVMNMEPQLIKEVDEIVKKEKLHSSRNEFIRDSVREKVLEYRRLKARNALKEIGENALKKGWKGDLLTKKEKDKIAKEFFNKKNISTK